MHLHHEGPMIWVQFELMICRGHIRASKDALQNFHFCLHFGCNFKGLKMGYEVKYHINYQFKHGLSDSSVNTGIILQEQKTCTFWSQSKNCYL